MSHTVSKHESNGVPKAQTVLRIGADGRNPESAFHAQRRTNTAPSLFVTVGGTTTRIKGSDLGALRDLLNNELPEEAFFDPLVWTDGDSVANTGGGAVRIRINGRWAWADTGILSESSDQRISASVRSGSVRVLLNQASA